MIDLKSFISDLRHVFGDDCKLPIAIWRSEKVEGEFAESEHCMFSSISQIEAGEIVSFTKDNLHCGGGRLYCGFMPKNAGIPKFVSDIEHYKQTPQMVDEFIDSLCIEQTEKKFLNFARIDLLDSLDNIEGIVFIDKPDVIAGLCAWTFYDTNETDAVSCAFGSGCSSIIASMITENRKKGHRTFLGMMDISARPHIGQYDQSFAIPLHRLEQIIITLHECCLWDAPAWLKLKERLNRSNLD